MNILALDMSTKSTGWATRVDGNLISGCISNSSTIIEKRIAYMRDEIIKLIELYKIDKIVNGNAVLHKVDLGTGFVARSNFNSKDNNVSAYYQFDASTGSWIDFSIYEN